MKKILLYLSLMTLIFVCKAQNYPTGQIVIKDANTHELYRDIKRVNFPIKLRSSKAEEIHFIDNSKNKYFPPIIYQVAGSCAYASGIGYIYNYEYNLVNDLESSKPENIYNYLQIYSFLNGGKDVGGHCQLGWTFIKENGVPSIKDGKTKTLTEWCTGYTAYYNGMEKSISDYKKFISDQDGEINKMKQYLLNHGDGSKFGGLIQFSAWAHNMSYATTYTGPSNTKYKAIIPKFGNNGMHSMTIVGFDDKVEWDYNEDGSISDDEKGAFLCVNTWGNDWGDNGRFYAPYKTFTTLKQGDGGIGNGGKQCLIVNTNKVKKRISLKITLSHDSRNDLEFEIGISKIRNATKPEKKLSQLFMRHQGGDYPMRGKKFGNNKILEFGLNIDKLLNFVGDDKNITYFLNIKDLVTGSKGNGEILACSLLDYRTDLNNPTEYIARLDKTVLSNGKECMAIINTSMPKLEEGINTNVEYIIDSYTKRMFIYLNSVKEDNIEIDIMNKNGTSLKQILNENVKAGLSSKIINIDFLSRGTYAIRVIAENKFIYEKLIIK